MLIDAPPAPPPQRADRPSRVVAAALITAAALTILDVSKVGVAIPVIQSSVGSGAHGETAVQLMMIGYTLAYAAALLPSGRLGDMYSRKRLFVAGLAVFVTASALCSLAPTIWWLVLGRVAQGLGAGILMPQVVGLIQRLYAPEARARPLAALAVTTSITSALGPVFAGVIMELAPGDTGWRLLFWVSVAAGAAVLPFAILVVREVPSERRKGFDGPGAVLLVLSVGLTVLPLGSVSGEDGASWWMPIPVAAGLLVGLFFVLRERALLRRGREPLLDLRLFGFTHFPTGLFIAGLMHASGTSSSLIITLYLQQAVGLTPLQTALTMILTAVAVSTSASLTARLPGRQGWERIWIGALVSTAALGTLTVLLATLPPGSMPLPVAALLFVNGIGTGMITAPNQARTLSAVPEFRASIAGSSIQLAQRLGSAVGMAFALIVYYGLGNGTAAGDPSPGGTGAFALCTLFLATTMVTALGENRRETTPIRG